MIENIKKEIQIIEDGDELVTLTKVYEILDKYNNQDNATIFIDTEDMEERYGTQLYIEYLERHKKAWDELINLYVNTFKDTRSKNDIMVLGQLKELSKKHNLDNKQVSIAERVDKE